MTSYFGSERRRAPRNSQHSFGTVFVRQSDSWMAREVLVMDVTNDAVRLRALPDLRDYEFCLQLDEDDTIYTPEIMRFERKHNSWEFTMNLGERQGREALAGLDVIYDFPRANANR
ncbi:MAG: hypothetical protein AB8G99_05625 [Planctomycetaceae bacterium]